MVLEGLGAALGGLPPVLWTVVHLVTALVAFWFAYKLKENSTWLWAFVLYGITGLLYALVHQGIVDTGATHYLESIFVFIAFLMLGMAQTKK